MDEKKGLVRELGLAECITITAGAVIGVGLFTVGSNQVGVMGSSVIVASVVSFLLVLWPSAIYGELGATLPLAGGTYSYAKRALNWPVAIFCSWHYTLAQIGIAGGEALAFANYINILFERGFGIPVAVDQRIIGAALMILFTIINYRGIKFSGRSQNAFMFFFWAVALIWMIMEFKTINFENFIPIFEGVPTEFTAFAKTTIMVWWCFAGFETCVGMGSEVKFPQITLPRATDSCSVYRICSKRTVPVLPGRYHGSCKSVHAGFFRCSVRRCYDSGRNHRIPVYPAGIWHHLRWRLQFYDPMYRRCCKIYVHHGS